MEPKSQSGDPLETLVLFFNKFYSIFSFLWSEVKEAKKEPLSQACHPHTLDANVCEKTKAGQLHTSNKNIDPRTCLYSIWVQTQILCVCLYACVSVCRGVCVCVCARARVCGGCRKGRTHSSLTTGAFRITSTMRQPRIFTNHKNHSAFTWTAM